jgi:hypothetical protein
MTDVERKAFYDRKRFERMRSTPGAYEEYKEKCRRHMENYRSRMRANPSVLWVRHWLSCKNSQGARNGMEFSLTAADIPWPADDRCPVFGFRFVYGYLRDAGLTEAEQRARRDMFPSVDRIDNSKGYVPGNVIVVSCLANRIKADVTAWQLRKVANFYIDLERRMELGV